MEINNGAQPENAAVSIPSRSPSGKSEKRKSPSIVSGCRTVMNERSFTNYWSVERFTVQLELHNPAEFMLAPKFGDGDYEFVMKLFPNGKDEETAGYLSLFLLINKCPNPRLRFRVSFTVETADGPRSCHLNKNLVTINRSGIVTASKFFSLDILRSAMNVYIPNDILTIGCELTIFGECTTQISSLFKPYQRTHSASSTSRSLSSPNTKCLKIDESSAHDAFTEFLSTGEFSDFIIVASCGREFPTHMCILAARSEYFKVLLRNHSTKEFMSKRLQFDDISARTLDVLLRHMYASAAGRVVKLEEDQLTEDLISAMDRLMINSLRDEVARLIGSKVTVDNVLTRISMAAELRLDDTYDVLLDFFSNHKHECMKLTAWDELESAKPPLAIKILRDAFSNTDSPSTTSMDSRIIDRITLT
ncbi:BTB and MATH domain-containing protein 41 [Caenorhabditis elegans]|uniref:BTB and MATH domain-containing protein 41 n=1 Tax=Caenorhabditis elegans TaxID=6239 RepID=BAT41_CAEEL|nr:BTB and MATH domain-containing protein 41 [Caenorhabditis elegans]P41886.1 RecName: Full=BTB and MATH domain-containing protein 41 [Caenorhabditis elegans]CCD70710.1 BTB and MATH domain-containing protein 41 [Caenorhabditis elegans]|eukprot:NP_498473.1 BTB and MATH domain-containing protein 41 [Caenorhabditis elegans]